MTKLIFIPKENLSELESKLKPELENVFSKGQKIAIKLHMGELGNKYFLKPDFVKRIVDVLKEIGAKPFLFDSPTMYPGARFFPKTYLMTAKKHGFSEKTMGCPVIVSNDYVEQKTDHLTIQVCKDLAEADGMLVLSHVKGHGCAGFGGAIKNLGMGGVTKQSKKDIHSGSKPKFMKECQGCGNCVDVCPFNAITMKEGKAKINFLKCMGCSACSNICPHDVLKEEVALFDTLLAEGAQAVLKKQNNNYYVNVIMDISRKCDCYGGRDNSIILDDIGIVMGKDIVAVDKASVDLVNKKTGKKDFFKNAQKSKKSPFAQIEESERLGMESQNYKF